MTIVRRKFSKGIRLKATTDTLTLDGEISNNSVSKKIEARLDGATRSVVTEDQVQTLTNKTIDVDNNTVSNIEVDNLKSGVLNTSTTLAAASDTQVPSALAVKTYVDDSIATINEASEISVTPAGTITSTDVQAALEELDTDIQNHINDTTDAHDASAVSVVPTGNLAADDVQEALNELQGDIDTLNTGLSNHLNDTTDAHDASAISVVPTGNLAADDVQEGLNELQGDIDTINSTLTNKVTGPASATDNAVVRYDATTGKLVQDSAVIIDDSNAVTGITELTVDNVNINGNTIRTTSGSLSVEDNIDTERRGETIVYDSTTSGSNVTIPAPTTGILHLSHASLVSINGISSIGVLEGQNLTLVNDTSTTLSINNDTGTASNRILTGTDTTITMKPKSALSLKYDVSGNRWRVIGGTGSSTNNNLNYIKNPTPETNTDGWVLYANTTPGSAPDNFGGTPSGNLDWTRNTTNALNNVSDFLLDKSATDEQGEGVYYEFDIQNGDKTVMQLLQFLKLDSSAYVDGDIGIFLVTSSDNFVASFNVIRPTNEDMLGGVPSVFKQFQFNSTDTKARLCIHIASINGSAYTVQFNDFQLGRSPVATSAVVLDWEEFTPTGTWIANTTYTGFYRRVGDSAEIFVRVDLSGAPTSTTLQVNLPSGLAIDTAKLADAQELGTAWISDSSTPTNRTKGSVADAGANNLQIFYIGGSTVTQAAPFTFATGDEVVLRAIVPIQGWSSNAVSSIDLGARDIRSEAVNSTVTAIGVSGAVHFGDVQENVGGNFWLNSTQFTPPETNDYSLNGYLVANASQTTWSIYVHDVTAAAQLGRPIGFSDGANAVSFSGTKNLIRGHIYELRTTDGYTPNSIGSSGITIKKFASPQTILQAGKVELIANSNSGQSFAHSTEVLIQFANVEKDSAGAWDTGASEYTVSRNGTISGRVRIRLESVTVGTGNMSLRVKKNGVSIEVNDEGLATANPSSELSFAFEVSKGDIIQFYLRQTNGVTQSLEAQTYANRLYLRVD